MEPRVQAAGEVGEGPGLLPLPRRCACEAAWDNGLVEKGCPREGQVWGWGPLCVNGPLSMGAEGLFMSPRKGPSG